jgi:hypothetical protein
MKAKDSGAWGLVALGLLLLILNQVAGAGPLIVWIVGGSCLTAGLVGIVVRNETHRDG